MVLPFSFESEAMNPALRRAHVQLHSRKPMKEIIKLPVPPATLIASNTRNCRVGGDDVTNEHDAGAHAA